LDIIEEEERRAICVNDLTNMMEFNSSRGRKRRLVAAAFMVGRK